MGSVYNASAIDDSYGSIDLWPSRAPNPEGSPLPDGPYNGPRSGRWNVASTINGSGIDDRCPTVCDVPKALQDGGSGRVKRIDGNAFRKLAMATEQERKAKERERRASEEKNVVADNRVEQVVAKEKQEKGFFVPKLNDSRGIRIKGRNGQTEIVKEPQLQLRPSGSHLAVPKKIEKEITPAAPSARAPSPSGPVRSGSGAIRRTNRVRIVGKNGQESFMELPRWGGSSNPISAPSPAMKQPQAPPAVDQKKQKAARDAEAARVAQQMRDERLQEETAQVARVMSPAVSRAVSVARSEVKQASSPPVPPAVVGKKEKLKRNTNAQKKTKQTQEAKPQNEKPPKAKAPPEALMSGALPVSDRDGASVHGSAAKGSSKASGEEFAAVFDKAPSVASSTTTVTRVGDKWKATSQHESKTESIVRSQIPASGGMQEVGWGFYEPGANGAASQAAKGQSGPSIAAPVPRIRSTLPFLHDSFHGMSGFEEIKPGSDNRWVNHNSRPNQDGISLGGWTNFCSGGKKDPPLLGGWSSHGSQRNTAPNASNGWDNRGSQAAAPTAFGGWSNRGSEPVNNPFFQSQPTQSPKVFAGRGWISPHPLSQAPSATRSPPQSVITLPGSQEERPRTMTYDEWRAMQQQSGSTGSIQRSQVPVETTEVSHRNISRTSSHAESRYDGGSWGRRHQPGYQSPTVESVGSRNQLDGVRELENGKVLLRMPWDR